MLSKYEYDTLMSPLLFYGRLITFFELNLRVLRTHGVARRRTFIFADNDDRHFLTGHLDSSKAHSS